MSALESLSRIALGSAPNGTHEYAAFATSKSRGPGPARSQSSISANEPFRKSAFHGDQSLWQMISWGSGPTRRQCTSGGATNRVTRSW